MSHICENWSIVVRALRMRSFSRGGSRPAHHLLGEETPNLYSFEHDRGRLKGKRPRATFGVVFLALGTLASVAPCGDALLIGYLVRGNAAYTYIARSLVINLSDQAA